MAWRLSRGSGVGVMGVSVCRDQVTASAAALQPAVVLELILSTIVFYCPFLFHPLILAFFLSFLSLSQSLFKRQGNQARLVEVLAFSPIFM